MQYPIIVKTLTTCPIDGLWVALNYPGLPVTIKKGDPMPIYGNIAVSWSFVK